MSLVRNFITVLSGRMFAQVLTVVAMPILARLYTPEDFGAVSVLTALIQVPAALYMWRYEQAIPQAKNDQEASRLFMLALLLAVLNTILAYFVIQLIPHSYIARFVPQEISFFFYLLPLLLLAQSMVSLLRQWAAYSESFKPGVWAEFTGTLGRRYLPMTLANVFPVNAWGLLSGLFIAPVLRTMTFVYYFLADRIHFKMYRYHELLDTAKTYKNFPLYLSWISLLELASLGLPTIILTYYYGLQASGWYGQAYALLLLPINLLAQSSGRVFYPRLAKVHHHSPQQSSALVHKVFLVYLDVTFYPFCALAIIAPDLWTWMLGEAFAPSGLMARALIPYMLIASIWSPMSVIVNVLHLQSALLKYTAMITIGRSIALWIGAYYGSMYTAILAYALSSTVIRAWQFAWLLQQIDVDLKQLAIDSIPRFVFQIPTLIVITYLCSHTGIIGQLLYCTMGAVVITGFLLRYHPTVKEWMVTQVQSRL